MVQKNRKGLKFQSRRRILERKQSKRVLKALKTKSKLGKNYKKTQIKINKLQKNMSKSSKGNETNHGKMIKQKSGLN